MSQIETQTLDVRDIIPMMRHRMIFQLFDGLELGSAFVLVNDHDPKPLYYQFLHERPDEFSWDYLQEGPEEWRVRIARVADS